MKKHLMRVAVILCFPLSLSLAQAGQWSAAAKIRILYPQYDGSIYIQLENIATSHPVEGCGSTYYLRLPPETIARTEIYSLLTATHFANQTIKLYVSGCSGSYGRVWHALKISQ